MIDALEIAGYQSLRKARIELGALTVIEGPSNSGKSALVRALVMLARNARGTAYISTGMTTCTVTAGSADEGWVLRLTRSTARGKDAYRLRILQGGVAGARAPAAAEFTKLQGGVPDEASELLRLGDLNIARQPDPPFLLTESGRDVAAVLGRLTNVSMVLAAAAEAGRRRKQAARDLKGADARLAELREQAQEFAGLGDRRRAIGRAEAALETAQGLAAQLEQLRGLSPGWPSRETRRARPGLPRRLPSRRPRRRWTSCWPAGTGWPRCWTSMPTPPARSPWTSSWRAAPSRPRPAPTRPCTAPWWPQGRARRAGSP